MLDPSAALDADIHSAPKFSSLACKPSRPIYAHPCPSHGCSAFPPPSPQPFPWFLPGMLGPPRASLYAFLSLHFDQYSVLNLFSELSLFPSFWFLAGDLSNCYYHLWPLEQSSC